MKVIKIGGGCLKGKKTIDEILTLVAERGQGDLFVVSALNGVTDMLITGMETAYHEEKEIPAILMRLRTEHRKVAEHVIQDAPLLETYFEHLEKSLARLERYYFGLNFTREITPRIHDLIASYGERLSAILLSYALRSRGIDASFRMPETIGLISDGKFQDASADIATSRTNFKSRLELPTKNQVLIIPGFFGISKEGDITTFGRGGSDYSAAVIAVCTEAEVLEFWKDVPGFLSADPRIVPDARLIPVLSYAEAAELSYFGAQILHPRAVEPARRHGLKIAIKNTLNPDAEASVIQEKSPRSEHVIKSVTHNDKIGILKVHASGVGARPGFLADVAMALKNRNINIKSVVTAQTCISLLLDKGDLEKSHDALMAMEPRPFRELETCTNVALVASVGEGQSEVEGIAALSFSSMAAKGINVEMIAFGPSREALYFIVDKQKAKDAIRSLHETFFEGTPL